MSQSKEINLFMKFPIVIVKESESPIYFFDINQFGLVSKSGESFYKKGIIYDSEGVKYLIEGIKSIKKAPILTSIKYFQQMHIVDVRYTAIGNVLLPEFKQVVINHIHSFKKYWIKRDLIESLDASISEKDSFSDIIYFIR
jgi:hypothetical protein